jgi:dTDP-4-amino-4,6-dideoxygalactose transaminase
MLAHRETPYLQGRRPVPLPVSEAASDNSLLLPLYPQMTDREQDQVIEALFRAADRGRPAAVSGRRV